MDCIFCKIILGELPSEIIASNQDAVAFRDMYPQAPVHILVVPRLHTKNIGELEDEVVLKGLFSLIREVAETFTDGEFKLQFNSGAREGQSVFHTHAHVISQRSA